MLTVEQIRAKSRNIRAMGAATIEAHQLDEIATEIERLQEVLRTITFRAQDAKRLCEEGAPVSAYNLASGILGQIGGDVAALTAESR